MEIFKLLQQERDHYKEVCLRQDLKIEVIIISFGSIISIYLYIYIYLYIFNIYETCKSIYHNQFKYIFKYIFKYNLNNLNIYLNIYVIYIKHANLYLS